MAQELQLHAQGLGIVVHGGLGDGVDPGEGQGRERGQLAGDDDDAPAVSQQGKELPIHPEHAEEIDIEVPEEVLLRHLREGGKVVDPRHVDDAVQGPCLRTDAAEGGLHLFRLRQIRRDQGTALRHPVRGPVQAPDPVARPRQGAAQGLPHAPQGAGDEIIPHIFLSRSMSACCLYSRTQRRNTQS